jgi:ATP-dependent Clp protease protease subunit
MFVDGLAASAASAVLMAGDKIVCAPGAQIMIHDPWSMAIGNAADLRQTADLLEQTGETLVSLYAARTKQSPDDIRAWMSAETWMTAQVAKERGFADELSGEPDGDEDGGAGDGDGDEQKARAQALLAQMKARITSRGSPQQNPGQPGK